MPPNKVKTRVRKSNYYPNVNPFEGALIDAELLREKNPGQREALQEKKRQWIALMQKAEASHK